MVFCCVYLLDWLLGSCCSYADRVIKHLGFLRMICVEHNFSIRVGNYHIFYIIVFGDFIYVEVKVGETVGEKGVKRSKGEGPGKSQPSFFKPSVESPFLPVNTYHLHCSQNQYGGEKKEKIKFIF
ncbi:hypothetical protein ES703_104380 [subsurface metagenome]